VPSAAPHPNGLLTLADAIERSCNVYFETQGHKLGIQGLSYWMRQFGYGRPSGIGLPEARGLVPDKARIDATQRGSAPLFSSIGQSWVLTTPIQVANEMATIARDGVWQRPTLLVDPPPATQPADPDAVPDRYDLHLDPTALREVQTGMMNVVNSRAGTGSQVRRDDVVVAAKTGSAQATPLVRNLPKINGRYQLDEDGHVRYEIIPYGSHDAPNRELPWYRMSGVDETTKRRKGTHSWVAGYAPATNPQVAFAVYVEYGGSGGIGAASVVNKLIESCIRHGYVTASGVVAPVVPANLARPEELPAGADE
jgi:penicillin-binding protein 2